MRALSRFAAVAAVACTCFWVSPGSAQELSKTAIAAAREVVIAKGAAATFDPVVRGVVEKVKQSFLPTNPNLSRELGEVAVALEKEYDPKRAEVLDQIAQAYARHFTEAELKELLVFYRTPLGQKWAREEPAAVQESIHRLTEWSNDFGETVLARFRNEMAKKGHPL
jgi:hypothetical protein